MEPNSVTALGLEVQSENVRGNTDRDYVTGCTPPETRNMSSTLAREAAAAVRSLLGGTGLLA